MVTAPLVRINTDDCVTYSTTASASAISKARRETPVSRGKVKGVPSSRAARLRTSWFVIGTAFGVLLSSTSNLTSGLSLNPSALVSLPEAPDMPELRIAFPDFLDHGDAPSKEAQLPEKAPAAVAVVAPPAPPPVVWPKEVSITVSSGDRLIDLLTNQGIAHKDAFEIIRQSRKNFDPRTLRSGHDVQLVLDRDASREEPEAASLKQMSIRLSSIEEVVIRAAGEGVWQAERVKEKVLSETSHGGGPIKSSFYVTARKLGIPDKAIVELIRAYSYDVDFQRDIHAGDALEVMYDRLVTADGDFVGSGDVLYAELKTRGKSLKLYRYTNNLGIAGFYNEKGENVRKALLRTPMDGARISSGFGMRRHPILGYSKMHRGVDFAAPRGTPIYAAGDGVVDFAAPFGSYGNYVRISHNGTYKTAYAHISRFASGIRKGSKVRQGQVIAYVGSTGRSTGPHLHYEILRGSTQVNPAGVKFAGGDRLTGRELAKFQETKRNYETRLANLKASPTKLASAE